ncbi:TonB-dependent receptor [Apibacter sp. HY039]|uniref:TonB-dependent receptor n=1 Tax=Apibacter sp. HY039 TaxID=2501476 RepID=UPI000FEBE52C|nr:TonB-dependent receptor [Apibacter sp. HY039]
MKIYFSLTAFFLFLTLYSQHFSFIEGKVEASNGLPIADAEIRFLKDSVFRVRTDIKGKFELKLTGLGRYDIQVWYKNEIIFTDQIRIDKYKNYYFNVKLNEDKELEINEIVIQGNKLNANSNYVAKLPLKNIENPQVYTVITKEMLSNQVITGTEDALKNVPGASNSVQGPGSGGIGLYVMMRGFSTDIGLRNGLSTNSATLTDMINVERLDVVKGPSGTLFGSVISYGGMINKITKKPYQKFGGNISYTTGSWGLSRLTADLNTPIKDSALFFRINTLVHKEDYFQDYSGRNTWAIDPSLTYKVTDRLILNLDFELFHTSGNTSFYGKGKGVTVNSFNKLKYNTERSLSDKNLVSEADVFNAFAEANYRVSEVWNSQSLFSFSKSDNKANYLFLTFTDNEHVQRKIMQIPSTFTRYNFQQNFVGRFNWGDLKNDLLLGIDYLYYTTEDKRSQIAYDIIDVNQSDVSLSVDKYNSLIAGTTPFAEYFRKHNTLGVYVSDVINIKERLNFMFSLRMDYYKAKGGNYLNMEAYNYNTDQTSWSPKLGIAYELVKNQISLFGNYMDGFNNVVDTGSPAGQKKSYKPEHANQWETGIKFDIWNHRIISTLSYYDIKVKNSLRTVSDGSETFTVQDGTRKSKGIDIEIKAIPLTGWNIFLGYGYNDSRYIKANSTIEGKHPYNTPYNSFNFWTEYTLENGWLKGLGVGLGGNSVSKSYWDDANTFELKGFTTWDAGIYYSQARYKLSCKINNLTNEKYWTSSYWGQPQKPKQILASLTFNF